MRSDNIDDIISEVAFHNPDEPAIDKHSLSAHYSDLVFERDFYNGLRERFEAVCNSPCVSSNMPALVRPFEFRAYEGPADLSFNENNPFSVVSWRHWTDPPFESTFIPVTCSTKANSRMMRAVVKPNILEAGGWIVEEPEVGFKIEFFVEPETFKPYEKFGIGTSTLEEAVAYVRELLANWETKVDRYKDQQLKAYLEACKAFENVVHVDFRRDQEH